MGYLIYSLKAKILISLYSWLGIILGFFSFGIILDSGEGFLYISYNPIIVIRILLKINL